MGVWAGVDAERVICDVRVVCVMCVGRRAGAVLTADSGECVCVYVRREKRPIYGQKSGYTGPRAHS